MISTRLVAYAPGADVPLGHLPEPLSWQCSLPHNDVGALTLKYSTLAARGDLLGRGLAEGLDVALEVDFGSGWIEPDGGRFLLRTRSRNLAGTDGVLDLTLPSYGALLADMRILALELLEVGGEFDGQRLFTAVNAGKILRPLLDEYASRHAQASALTWSFTASLDSALVAWPATEWAIPYQAGVDLRSVLGGEQTAGLTSLGLCDWRTRGRELMAWVKDSQAVDRSELVRLELTRDIRDAPLTETLDGTAGYTLVRGEGSVIATVISEDAPSPWGVAEAYLTASGATSVEAAQEMVALEVERRARETAEYTQQLTLDPDGVLPLRDYLPGDVISAPAAGGRRAMRVQQVTLSMDGGTLSGSVILNDRLVPADLRVAGRLRAIAGGSAAGGTGGVPSAPPLPIPNAPTGVTLSSLGYWVGSSARSSVSASWVAVAQSTESKPIAIDHYVMRVSGGLETTAPGTSATIDGLTPSTPVQVQVAAVSDKGVQGAWSAPVGITTAVTLSRLDPPVALSLSTGDGTVRASWDGTLQAPPAAAHPAPPEFARLRVEVGTSGSGPWTAAGSLDTPGRWIIPATPGQTVWVRGVAADRLGLESVPGPVSSIEATSAVAEAVAEALGKAEQALEDAADAQTTADGKNRVTTSVAEPAAEGREQGDRWYVVDPDEAGQITTVKVWNGTAWVLYREVAGSVLVPGSVGSVLIEDGAITADSAIVTGINAGKIVSGEITATLSVTAGALQIVDAEGTPRTVLKSVGSVFSGKVDANDVTVAGGLAMKSDSNELGVGGKLFLREGVSSPAAPLVLENYWPTVTLKTSAGVALTSVVSVSRMSDGKFVAYRYGPSGGLTVHNADGTWVRSVATDYWADEGALGFNPAVQVVNDHAVFVRYPGDEEDPYRYYDLVAYNLTSGARTTYSGGTGTSWRFAWGVGVTVGWDGGTRLLVTNASTGAMFVHTFTWSDDTFTTSVASKTIAGLAGASAIARSNFDLGADSVLAAVDDTTDIKAYTYSSAAVNANAAMAAPAAETRGLGYYSGVIWVAAGNTVHLLDGYTWTDAGATKTVYVGITHFDSVGTQHESKISPTASFAYNKRARWRVVGASIATPAGVDDIDGIRVYAGTSAGSLYRQGNTTGGSSVWAAQTLTLTGTVYSLANKAADFPSAAPAQITNDPGTLVIKADGTIQAASVAVTGDTNGWVLIEGFSNSFSADTTDPPAYMIRNGICYLSGHVWRSSAPTSLTTAFTLPVGPRSRTYQHMNADWGQGVSVFKNGIVQIIATAARTANPGYFLEGISFPVQVA